MRSAPVNVSFAQPVSVSAALRAGMTRDQLRSRQLQTPFTGVRIGVAAPNDLVTRCLCLQEVLPSDAVFSGMTAAALHGWWLPFRPSFIDVTVSGSTPRARRAGVRCHQADIAVDQRTLCHGLAVTDAVRTLADLAAQYGLADLVVMADSALRRGDCDVQALLGFAEIAGGRRGIRTFRRMTKLSDNRVGGSCMRPASWSIHTPRVISCFGHTRFRSTTPPPSASRRNPTISTNGSASSSAPRSQGVGGSLRRHFRGYLVLESAPKLTTR